MSATPASSGASPRLLAGKAFKVLFVGPTSAPWDSIAAEVEADIARLARPGVDLTYRCTGQGPAEIHTDADARAAAPFVVATVVTAASEGFDAVIVDCTADPGVAKSRHRVAIPVVGPGEAMRAAIARAPRPICLLSGDDLRAMDRTALLEQVRDAATVALGGTGFSHLTDTLITAHPGVVVLDPLAVALATCLARLTG
jgi:Asp/Glu/hydantoin racemase